jgi:hypothetical protein
MDWEMRHWGNLPGQANSSYGKLPSWVSLVMLSLEIVERMGPLLKAATADIKFIIVKSCQRL